MTSVARVTLEAKCQFESSTPGVLALATDDADIAAGFFAIDDTDVAAGVFTEGDWTASFTGANDDLSKKVSSLTITGGRDDLLSTMQGLIATVELRDPTGLLNAANPASPLYGQTDETVHPFQIRLARNGVWRTRFYGVTRRIAWEPSGRKGTAQIEAVDLFWMLGRSKPIIASTGPTTTGGAIAAILDTVRIADPAARSLGVGDPLDDFSADGSLSPLDLIGNLLEAERGVFYIRGDGAAIYEDRYARLLRTSRATIADRMSGLSSESDFDLLKNRVTVIRVDAAGNTLYTATAQDADSIIRLGGPSDADPIETPYLRTNLQADGLAAWLLPIVKTAHSPIRDFAVDGRDADVLDSILDIGLVDRITVSEESGGTAGDYHVERFTITVAPGGRTSATYLLSEASTETLLTFAINDADVAAGTFAANDADATPGVGVFVY